MAPFFMAKRSSWVLGILCLGAFALVACGSPAAISSTATTASTTTSTTNLAALRSKYFAAVNPLGEAIETWDTQYAQLESQATTTGIVTPAQIAAVTNPVIAAIQTTVNNLSNMSFPASIDADVRSLIAALSSFEGDEREVVLEWPNAQSVQAQGTADIAKANRPGAGESRPVALGFVPGSSTVNTGGRPSGRRRYERAPSGASWFPRC